MLLLSAVGSLCNGMIGCAFSKDSSGSYAKKRFQGQERKQEREVGKICPLGADPAFGQQIHGSNKSPLSSSQSVTTAAAEMPNNLGIQVKCQFEPGAERDFVWGTVQRKPGQVATLLSWHQQAEQCSVVMDGFTLFPAQCGVWEGGGWHGPWGAQRSLRAFLVFCLPRSISGKALTLCSNHVSAQKSHYCQTCSCSQSEYLYFYTF